LFIRRIAMVKTAQDGRSAGWEIDTINANILDILLSLVANASAMNCMQRLVSKLNCYVSHGILNAAYSLSDH